MSEELKPCPFCGEHLKSDGHDSDYYTHPKSECHFSEWEFPCMSGDNLEKWNRRAASTRTASDNRTAAGSLQEAIKTASAAIGDGFLHPLDHEGWGYACTDCGNNKADGHKEECGIGKAVQAIDLALSEAIKEPLKWESTTPVYTRFITDSRYQKLRPSFQKWYRPICENRTVSTDAATPHGEMATAGERMARWLSGLSQSEAMPESWRATCAELAQAWQGVAGTEVNAGAARQGGVTQPIEPPRYSYGQDGKGPVTFHNPMSPRDFAAARPAEVDVEAERKLYLKAFPSFLGYGWTGRQEDEFKVWLAARTQADAGQFGPLFSTRQDAARFQRAIAAEDNAETLYAAVMSHAPDGNAIRAEFDAMLSGAAAHSAEGE